MRERFRGRPPSELCKAGGSSPFNIAKMNSELESEPRTFGRPDLTDEQPSYSVDEQEEAYVVHGSSVNQELLRRIQGQKDLKYGPRMT